MSAATAVDRTDHKVFKVGVALRFAFSGVAAWRTPLAIPVFRYVPEPQVVHPGRTGHQNQASAVESQAHGSLKGHI